MLDYVLHSASLLIWKMHLKNAKTNKAVRMWEENSATFKMWNL